MTSTPRPDLAAIIHRVQSRLIRAADASDVFDPLLPELLAITDSGYGFVGEVWRDPPGAPYLKIFTLTDIAWDAPTRELYARERRNGIEFRNLDNLLGAAIITREPVIANAPQADARSGGLPSGHPPMHAYLGMPLFHGGELVGVAGLANRPGGYDMGLVQALQPLWSAVGAIIGAVQLQRDRQRAVAALASSEAMYRATFEAAPVGIAHQRPDGWITHVNRHLCAMLGYDAAELTRMHWPQVTHDDDVPVQRAHVAELLSGRVAEMRIEKRYRRRDGGIVWGDLRMTLVRDAAGVPDHLIGVVQDITERKRYEQALVAAEAADRANAAKTEFLSRMSHELRTPLNAVLGFAQLLRMDQRTPLAPSQRERVEHIERAGAHLLAMINDVLDLSRIEAGALALSIETLQLQSVVAQALELVTGAAHDAGVTLRHEPSETLHLLGDRVRLRQVLVNLLSNAIKYNHRGGTVTVSGRRDGDAIWLSVADTGAGLSETQLQQLFQPFNRLGAERGNVEGTGIGLVITRRLVELMHGRIDVGSRPGVGSVFSVLLPAAELPPAPAADALPQHGDGAAGGQPLQLLYVEDNVVNVELVRQVLRLRPRVRLQVAESGERALEMTRAERPDVLLIDMQLGDMSGLELVDALDRDPATAGIPRIALSADAMPERVRAAKLRGFSPYLTKPLDIGALLRCVDERLDALPSAAAPQQRM